MALEHALLISLREQPATGYELTRRFSRSLGYVWPATHQQIYRTLSRMAEWGWVVTTEVEQAGRPDKKVHAVTAAGRRELKGWIASASAAPAPVRDDLVVKLRGAAYGDADSVRAQARSRRELHQGRLDEYHAIEARDFPSPATLSGQRLHQWLVLRAGIRLEENEIGWCDEVIDALTADQHGTDQGALR